MVRMGELRHVFGAAIKYGTKRKIYKTVVCTLFTYGSEDWNLRAATIAAINGVNSRCMSRITHKYIHEEVSEKTRSFDLVGAIR